ncbi:MAG TPA: hypothetical protein VII01_03490 [Solirubrobacteraceae bacterium]|jgi:hypothetical protein
MAVLSADTAGKLRSERGRLLAARLLRTAALPSILVLAALAPAGASAALSASKWEAGTCKLANCTDAGPTSSFYTQAAGHPNFGITDFEFNFREVGLLKAKEPEGKVRDVRVDLPSGLAVNPEATTERCTDAQINELNCPAGSQVGYDEATGTAEFTLGVKSTVTEKFPVFNMVRKPGQPARFGVELKSVTLALVGLQNHLFLEGGISWHHEPETSEDSGVASGDFHEFFKIENIPAQPEVVESRLVFWGVPQEEQTAPTSPPTGFITLPSTCDSKPITWLHVDAQESPGSFLAYKNEAPVIATGCGALAFNPSLSLAPGGGATQSDTPDGPAVDLHIPQTTFEPSKPNSPDLQSTEVTLPEGMTLNPSAAHGLEGCTNAEIGIGTDNPIGCPAGSVIGSVSINAPGIPDNSLTGTLYLGAPEPGQGPETGHEYRVFLAALAPQYGVGLRLEGQVRASKATGRLTAVFAGTPQVPFEEFRLQFKEGPRAPLANPLACTAVAPSVNITPYGGEPPKAAASTGFSVTGCGSPLPFSLVQSIPAQTPPRAGAYSPFTLGISRKDAQQYPSQIATTLPAGLLGAIPSVPLCGEPLANQGKCPASSEIGTVTVAAGAGSEPYSFTGHAYLTGPYGGSPYGLSIVVPAVAGPYNLGNVITRAGVGVGLYSGRVTVSASIPTVVEGVPLRLKSLTVAVNRHNFIFNPSSCNQMATESLLTSTMGAKQLISSPFQVGSCEALAFKPVLGALVSGKTTKAGGAGIQVDINQGAHQANIRQVILQLPKALPSRLTTLQKACTAARFDTGPPPGTCHATGLVGTVKVTTPVLPGKLTGPAYLVSHGGGAFPDLDLVLHGPNGLEVVLVGRTNISKTGITSSNFESVPDVPITNVEVSLPAGPNSVLTGLTANAKLCGKRLLAPTTLVAQSGARIVRNTPLVLTGCGLRVVRHRVKHKHALITLEVAGASRVTVSGSGVRGTSRRLRKAQIFTVSLPLSRAGKARLRRHHRKGIVIKLHISYVPASGKRASAQVKVRFH